MASAPTRLWDALWSVDVVLLNGTDTEVRAYRVVTHQPFVAHHQHHQWIATGTGWNRHAAIADVLRQIDAPIAAKIALAEMVIANLVGALNR